MMVGHALSLTPMWLGMLPPCGWSCSRSPPVVGHVESSLPIWVATVAPLCPGPQSSVLDNGLKVAEQITHHIAESNHWLNGFKD